MQSKLKYPTINFPESETFEVGVAIIFLIKNGGEKKVYYADLWADRDSKYQWLLSHDAFNTKWIELKPAPQEFWFYPKESSKSYDGFPLLSDMMPFHREGIKTHRDWLVVGFDKEEIITRLNSLKTLSEDEILIALQLGEQYRTALRHAKKLVLALPDIDEHKIERYSYRPFDTRFIYYDHGILDRPRPELYKQMGGIFLVTRRNSRQWPGLWSFAYVTNEISDIDMRGGVYVFPLVVNGKPNFSKTFSTWVTEQFGQLFDSQSLLGYIYGILYCNSYRKKYGSELRTCFPRIPLTPDKELFIKISSIGKELIELHLLSSRKIWQSMAGFPEIGNDIVEKISYDPKDFRVMINSKQYFSKIEPEIWNYEVGGYRVCERWLRERNGRKLNSDDQTNFMRIVGSIKETLKLQQELDALFPQIEQNVISLIQPIEQQKLLK